MKYLPKNVINNLSNSQLFQLWNIISNDFENIISETKDTFKLPWKIDDTPNEHDKCIVNSNGAIILYAYRSSFESDEDYTAFLSSLLKLYLSIFMATVCSGFLTDISEFEFNDAVNEEVIKLNNKVGLLYKELI